MRRLNRSAFRIKLLTMLGVAAAVILGFVIFFKIQTISVAYYVNEQEMTEEWIRKADVYMYTGENELCSVLEEEANRYFAGEITAKQAAEYVQNRVSIYLAEQG